MDKQFVKDAFGWGFVLWLFGAILGFIFFFLMPKDMIGWAITPFGIAFTLWVIFKKIHADKFHYYLHMAIVWTLIAIVCDYIFGVKLFGWGNDYYKLDIYIYYALTLLMPLGAYWYKKSYKK